MRGPISRWDRAQSRMDRLRAVIDCAYRGRGDYLQTKLAVLLVSPLPLYVAT